MGKCRFLILHQLYQFSTVKEKFGRSLDALGNAFVKLLFFPVFSQHLLTNGDFFRGGVCRTFFKIVNILTYTCPNHSGVGVIDSPDRFQHVLHSYCIHQVLEKNFRHEIFIVRPQKMPKNGLFWRF